MHSKMLINVLGPPSAGKSVLSARLFAHYKIKGISTELVQEYAKTLIWKNELGKLNDQLMVTSRQYENIKEVYMHKDIEFVVTDSPIELGIFYNLYNRNNKSDIQHTRHVLEKYRQEFNNVYIFVNINKDNSYEECGRIHNKSQSLLIQKQLKSMLEHYNIEYFNYTSNKTCISNVVEYINDKRVY